jgi:lysine 6-dehydrogenase
VGGHSYGIVGAGRQGTAAAYDLAVRGDADRVVFADLDGLAAERAANRVNALSGRGVATAVALDAADLGAVTEFLGPLDAVVSSAHYRLNLGISKAAIEAGTHVCDLGGHTGIVRRQLDLDDQARARGVCVVPDCGEAPGLANNLQAYALSLVGQAEDLVVYDGGLPLDPEPPWRYVLTFSFDGLINEYDGTTTWVRAGEVVDVPCLDPSEDETVEFEPPFGTLEAFVAATSSTTPWTLGPRVRSLRCKVLRYPGHAAQFRAFRDAGLFGEDPMTAGDVEVVPRRLLQTVLEPQLLPKPGQRDAVVARVVVRGRHEGSPSTATVDFRAYPDDAPGFTAMECATGWHAAIVCHLMASGSIEPGATPVELAVDPEVMMNALLARGFEIRMAVSRAES